MAVPARWQGKGRDEMSRRHRQPVPIVLSHVDGPGPKITLVNSPWFRSFAEFTRRQLLRNWFEVADEYGVTIRVHGQPWYGSGRTKVVPRPPAPDSGYHVDEVAYGVAASNASYWHGGSDESAATLCGIPLAGTGMAEHNVRSHMTECPVCRRASS